MGKPVWAALSEASKRLTMIQTVHQVEVSCFLDKAAAQNAAALSTPWNVVTNEMNAWVDLVSPCWMLCDMSFSHLAAHKGTANPHVAALPDCASGNGFDAASSLQLLSCCQQTSRSLISGLTVRWYALAV